MRLFLYFLMVLLAVATVSGLIWSGNHEPIWQIVSLGCLAVVGVALVPLLAWLATEPIVKATTRLRSLYWRPRPLLGTILVVTGLAMAVMSPGPVEQENSEVAFLVLLGLSALLVGLGWLVARRPHSRHHRTF